MNLPTPTPAPVADPRFALDVDAGERETLLAALEIAQALAGGDAIGARFLATDAYSGSILRAHADALADRVFNLGMPPTADALPALARAAQFTA